MCVIDLHVQKTRSRSAVTSESAHGSMVCGGLQLGWITGIYEVTCRRRTLSADCYTDTASSTHTDTDTD